jgi:hypothetical protein
VPPRVLDLHQVEPNVVVRPVLDRRVHQRVRQLVVRAEPLAHAPGVAPGHVGRAERTLGLARAQDEDRLAAAAHDLADELVRRLDFEPLGTPAELEPPSSATIKETSFQQLRSQLNAIPEVGGEHGHGRAAAARSTDNDGIGDAEVTPPPLAPQVEQGCQFARYWVDAREIRSLVAIAMMARKRKIIGMVATAMLPGNDVLDVKPEERFVFLMEAAIFAAMARTGPDELPCGGIHQRLCP